MRIPIVTAAAALLMLAGCGRHEPTPGEQAAKAADNRADAIDQGAGKIEGPPAANMHDAADAVRDQGKAEKKALDHAGQNNAR